jgi:hypothetical protein
LGRAGIFDRGLTINVVNPFIRNLQLGLGEFHLAREKINCTEQLVSIITGKNQDRGGQSQRKDYAYYYSNSFHLYYLLIC